MKTAARWLLIVLAAVLHGGTLAQGMPEDWYVRPPSDREAYLSMEGQPMPPLMLDHWRNAEGLDGLLDGKVVVVDFWATWCAPCIAEMPELNKLYEKYRGERVEVVGICGSALRQELFDDVVEQHEIKFPVARDSQLKTEKLWNLTDWPTYAVVDRKGMVRAIGLKATHLERAIDRIIKEQPAESTSQADPSASASSGEDS